ncbi:type II secretion system F family protein [Chloracidobacterium aggregatum]|jgi:type IV pilus assembly protein PilC|uniref:Type II secretion system F family protein n=1 Tax=Chloracidobacterium sp. N TaxID=2821540 RepID=A0ABX8B1L2_9BACT|nr:type II secretion system F family protein [Chloracidobacterium aggregatum]QUV84254.1 type II secretion system F family protein [Chloracidobacterium sp. 2]QUV87257.1 type II secretion system F family protein [Chloracidobacterium sp. S]QUV90163.1 type II secretion system F family protein [Chloracidobacterium sp. A]QUV93374.1 type II secretion system F family protein [Chloracidobacterium sp. N]QUV96530.1 type II secretion system F family protein [Chloracidobacterium sp. E]
MPTYVFVGRNQLNQQVRGERTAASREQLESLLRREQVTLLSVQEKSRDIALPKLVGGSVSSKELAIFTRQFSVMIDAGLPLVQCLEILASQQDKNKYFKQVLTQVRTDVESGSTLSDAMAKHPKVFDNLYTNMVAAGETGGILDTILQRLATFIEKIVKLRSDVISALIYPSAVIVLAIAVISVIMIVVIPAFRNIFEGLLGPGERLPLPTEIVIAVSAFMASYWWLLLIIIGAIVWVIRAYYKTPGGRLVIDRLMLKIPVIGDILLKIAVARFSRTLATLLSSGVPILESLDITARTAGNVVVSNAINRVRDSIEQGQTIVEPLKASGVFPSMVCQMIGVGEQTGALDAMLSKIADFYELEVDAAIANLLTLIEPIMIGFLGVTIGGIVIAMYLPLFALVGKLAGR